MFDLLYRKPEQERELLSQLVNKLGDPVKKVASKAGFFLLKFGELSLVFWDLNVCVRDLSMIESASFGSQSTSDIYVLVVRGPLNAHTRYPFLLKIQILGYSSVSSSTQ